MSSSLNNVITFPRGFSNISLKTDDNPARLTRSEEEDMLSNAGRILTDIEALWETDHGSLELRDKIHLLRYYLNYLKQHFGQNK